MIITLFTCITGQGDIGPFHNQDDHGLDNLLDDCDRYSNSNIIPIFHHSNFETNAPTYPQEDIDYY